MTWQVRLRQRDLNAFESMLDTQNISVDQLQSSRAAHQTHAPAVGSLPEAKYAKLKARIEASELASETLPASALSAGRHAVKQLQGEQLDKERRELERLEKQWRTPADKTSALETGTRAVFEDEVSRLEFNISAAVGLLVFMNFTAYKVVGMRRLEKLRTKQIRTLRNRYTTATAPCVTTCCGLPPVR
jgi:hypothetical protein